MHSPFFGNVPSRADCSTACGDQSPGQAARYCSAILSGPLPGKSRNSPAHATEIQRRHGYRDFHEQPEHFRLIRWLYTRAWVSAERPIAVFDLTTARLVKQKILLAGVTTLTRLVASVRDRAAGRLWHILAELPSPLQRRRLLSLLQPAEDGNRYSLLDRLRRAPTRISAAGMLDALDRLSEFRALRVEDLDLAQVPPGRLRTLARYAALSKAQAIQRMPDERQIATLLAFARVYESVAQDDAVDLLHQFIGTKLLRAEHTGERERLRTLRDQDAPRGLLTRPWRQLVERSDGSLDRKFYTFCVLERLHDGLHRRDVFLTRSERWADPRAKLLQGQAWEAARPSVCRALGRELSADREIEALSKQLDEAYRRTAAMRPSIEDLRITQINGKDRLALTPLDKLDEPPSLLRLKDQVGSLLPRVDLPDAILEIHALTGFADEFAHIIEGRGRFEDLTLSICAVLVGESCKNESKSMVRPG